VPGSWRTAGVLLAVLLGLLFGPAPAAVADSTTYVKYYVVAASYQGEPEDLLEISDRFLGSADRSTEILVLNRERTQGDGAKLTDPARLRSGWVLVLPWDAVGDGVQYGLLPAALTPAGPKAGGTRPGGTPCAGTPVGVKQTQSQWALLRLAPQHAWTYTRGRGVTVAVVDSGVDATRPELAGRVTTGVDVIAGSGRGDTDCLGSGTAMAGIIAGRTDGSGTAAGVAPEATIMPVRVAPTDTPVSESNQASAIQVASATGAQVIALGSFIDPNLPAVANAIRVAVAHNTVVVCAAPPASANQAPSGAGLLRVGAITIDGTVGGSFRPGAVDVVAPGVDVASIGISGTGQSPRTGSQYAVAFAAGELALVRAMYPELTPAQVVRRVQASADRMGSTVPDPTFGFGLINPGVAVTRVIADEGRSPDAGVRAGPAWSGTRQVALAVTLAVVLLLILLLVLRARRMVRDMAAPAVSGDARPATDPGTVSPLDTAATPEMPTAPRTTTVLIPALTEPPDTAEAARPTVDRAAPLRQGLTTADTPPVARASAATDSGSVPARVGSEPDARGSASESAPAGRESGPSGPAVAGSGPEAETGDAPWRRVGRSALTDTWWRQGPTGDSR
jgi:membrane-anchored mycosin MYCP